MSDYGKLSDQEMREEAVKCLCLISHDNDVLFAFAREGEVTYFDGKGLKQDLPEEIAAKIKDVEEKKGCKIYAVLKTVFNWKTDPMETYSFLCISNYTEDLPYSIKSVSPTVYQVHSYVFNKSIPEWSEFGHVIVQSDGFRLVRIR